jgi:hypothetical protein
VKAAILLSIFTLTLAGQASVRIPYDCSPEDIDALGLTCTEDEPCAVFLELASAEAAGGRLFVSGNLHTGNTTLFGILLASDDGGATWTEPQARIRNGALEQIEFLDLQTGWVSGESIDPLARNPFLLLTGDGGKTWRQRLLSEDAKFGVIAQFHFDSKTSGELVLDASQGKTTRQELYETMTGGEGWELKQVSDMPLRLKNARNPGQASWRVRADAASDTYRLERGGGRTWETVTSFAIHIADCK